MIEGLESLISALSRTSHLARLICPRLGHAPSRSEPPLSGGHDGNNVANHHTRSEHAAASDKIATVADPTAQISLDYHRRVPSKGIASRFCRTSTETLLQQLHVPDHLAVGVIAARSLAGRNGLSEVVRPSAFNEFAAREATLSPT
jgi:hypothetical protein